MKLRVAVVGVVFAFVAAIHAPSASAHAALESTQPAKGSVVSKSTKIVSMQFGEEILVLKGKSPNSISVLNSHGDSVASGDVIVAGNQISRKLMSPLVAGKYTVKYRVVSADGHVVNGSYTFTVK